MHTTCSSYPAYYEMYRIWWRAEKAFRRFIGWISAGRRARRRWEMLLVFWVGSVALFCLGRVLSFMRIDVWVCWARRPVMTSLWGIDIFRDVGWVVCSTIFITLSAQILPFKITFITKLSSLYLIKSQSS
jgi:hypothetical protein